MKYGTHIEALRREMNLDIRFTQFGFKEVQGIDCPNPDNKDWLNEQYEKLMHELFSFLQNEPDKEIIEDFVIKQIDSIDQKQFLKTEYDQLLLCYTGSLYFILGLKRARKHYDLNKRNGPVND